MKLKSFLKLVEIQTKVASVIPYLTAMTYVLYRYKRLNALNMLVMFFAMVIFDMTVTALNNYYDHKRAIKKHGYNYEVHNSIVQYNLKQSTVLTTIIVMCAIAAALGIYLVYLTNVLVLIIGFACFAIGILYSFGPMPISRTPFGEIFSGITMGFGIIFITFYINIFSLDILDIGIKNSSLYLSFDMMEILAIVLVSLPAVFGIANIMLANNICDIEDDISNKRHTLPIVIGRPNSVVLLEWLFYLSYAAIVVCVILSILPLYSLLVLLTLIIVIKNIKLFKSNPTKKDTFGAVVASFVIINVSLILTISLGVLDSAFLNFLVK